MIIASGYNDHVVASHIIFEKVGDADDVFYECIDDDSPYDQIIGKPNDKQDINIVSEATLMTVDGVGVILAARICAYRPFDSWEDVGNLKYVGPIRLKALQRAFTLETFDYGMCVTDTANEGDVIPAGETVSAKIAKSTKHRRRRLTLAQKAIISLMLLIPSADSEALAVCCEESREHCEQYSTPLSVCMERVERVIS